MDIQQSVREIKTYLELERVPVGIKFLWDEDSYQNFPIKEYDRKITYCNAVQRASKGLSFKVSAKHQACPNGAMALHMKDIPEKMADGRARKSKNIYETVEISKSISDGMKFLEKEPAGIIIQPLSNFKEEPDMVLVVSGSYQIMRMIQGHGYFNGYTTNLKTIGLQAVCHDITTYPYLTNEINITFLCPGTRLVAGWNMHELGIGISWDKWYQVVEGVIQTTNPFARNAQKRKIVRKLEEQNEDTSDIRMNENYDDGSYTGGKIEK